jgi:hypothetical protein
MSAASHTFDALVKHQLLPSTQPMLEKRILVQGLSALAIFLVLIGIGFLLYGAHTWLAFHYNPQTVAALTGVLSLLVASLVIAVGFSYLAYRQRYIREMRQSMLQKLEALFESLDSEIGGVIQDHPKTSVLLAALIGFFIEERI